MSDLIQQGVKYMNKKKEGMKDMFTRKREGFAGILGANDTMDLVNNNELDATNANVYSLTQNITSFQTAGMNLQEKTNEYLNTDRTPKPGDPRRNYNVFINKSPPPPAMTANPVAGTGTGAAGTNTNGQCISIQSLGNFLDSSANGFDAAYPKNFKTFESARTACQMWAADLGFSYFGITKPVDTFHCYTSNVPPLSVPTTYTSPGVLYTVATGTDTTAGGLFGNGQIGVYRSSKMMRWNIQNMPTPMTIKKYNNRTYSSTDANRPYYNDKVLLDRWWGENGGDGKWDDDRNIGSNIFPNDKTAWWIGYSTTPPTDKDWLAKEASRWAFTTTDQIYFYYVYNNTSGAPQTISIYMLLQTRLKVNGVPITLVVEPGRGPTFGGKVDPNTNTSYRKKGAYMGDVTLKTGKNVFEIPRSTGYCNSGFMAYFYDKNRTILFRTGDPGWGVTTTPAPDWNMVTNIPVTAQTMADPYMFSTVNTEPNGFSTCDKLIGGAINTKTINATYGKNCSTSTKKPLNVRYISVWANDKGDPLQISQLVVIAFLNGIQQNVATRGTITTSTSLNNLDPAIPVNGKLDNKLYWSSTKSPPGSTYLNGLGFWYLDLGTEYPLVSITFYNRPEFNWYADGVNIGFKDGKGASYTLINPIKLTGQLVQKFGVSEEDIYRASPWYTYAPTGWIRPEGALGYGIYTGQEAAAICAQRGQRICQKSELALYDHCAAAWNDDLTTMGYPMAHGDPQCQGDGKYCGYCGGMTPGKAGFKPWVDWAAGPAGVYCCDKDHVGVYDPAETPMTRG